MLKFKVIIRKLKKKIEKNIVPKTTPTKKNENILKNINSKTPPTDQIENEVQEGPAIGLPMCHSISDKNLTKKC